MESYSLIYMVPTYILLRLRELQEKAGEKGGNGGKRGKPSWTVKGKGNGQKMGNSDWKPRAAAAVVRYFLCSLSRAE